MTKVLVPSDITLVEEKHKMCKRRIRFSEKLGLMGMLPMYHWRYSELDKHDMRDILRRKFNPDSSDPAIQICLKRQEAVRKEVVAHNFVWAGLATFSGITAWSLRRYAYQTKLIVLPFLAYAGVWVGKVVGDGLTGRWGETARDRFLASLPAKMYLQVPDQ